MTERTSNQTTLDRGDERLEDGRLEQPGFAGAGRRSRQRACDLRSRISLEDDLGLDALGEAMAEAGEIEWAIELRPRFRSQRHCRHLLKAIVYAHARAGRLDLALAAAAQIEDSKFAAGVRVGIAAITARGGHTEEALAIADDVRRQGRLEEGNLASLAVATVAAGKPSEGPAIARGLTSADQISRVYSAVGAQ